MMDKYRAIAAVEELLAALRAERDLENHWIGPCPLPGNVAVKATRRARGDAGFAQASFFRWGHCSSPSDIAAFSYLADNAAGWVPRPARWVPPEEAYPLEMRESGGHVRREGDSDCLSEKYWHRITHIRLLPRETKLAVPELPEWARVDCGGWLVVKVGGDDRHIINHTRTPGDLDRIAEACRIRAAQLMAGG